MTSPTIVNRYANALADVILSAGSAVKPADALNQLRSFDQAARSVPALSAILASPAVSKVRKRTVIRTIAQALGLQQILINFLLVLTDRRRSAALHETINALETVLDERLGFESVEVRSAFELSKAQSEELTRRLGRLAGRQIRMHQTVDPELIGGVTVRVGSTNYDGSVRGHLAAMRESLAAGRQ